MVTQLRAAQVLPSDVESKMLHGLSDHLSGQSHWCLGVGVVVRVTGWVIFGVVGVLFKSLDESRGSFKGYEANCFQA